MKEYTFHEPTLVEKIPPHFRALLPKLSYDERKSLEQNVNPDNIGTILSWIGNEEEIEKMLFWDKGGKYDDPEWQGLEPVDEMTGMLYERVYNHYNQLKKEAVEIQMRSDLALYSQFNEGLLFTGIAGALRCKADGLADDQGPCFKGVELRCIGSVEEGINSITIYPLTSSANEFEVHFGTKYYDKPQGIQVCSADSFTLIELAKLIERDLSKSGYETVLRDRAGRIISLEPKAIRRAARKEQSTGYDSELTLFASAQATGIEKAIEVADELSRSFYRRFGLETESYKIGKKYGNFHIMRNDNFEDFFPEKSVKNKRLVMFTATLECRRCRRELEGFRDLARLYPDVTFALVNLVSPQFKFYERVFGDMGGGDPKGFRDNAMGSTPFTIIYIPDEKGVLKFVEYFGTEKAEAPPSFEESKALLDRYEGR